MPLDREAIRHRATKTRGGMSPYLRQALDELDNKDALLKRCFLFIEDLVDNRWTGGENETETFLDLTTASILLVDLQEVTR